jgi:hypothetical protein
VGLLKGGEPFFRSLWQWLLKISHAPQSTEQLLSQLARQQPLEGIGEPDERADLLDLFCERDLLELDETGSYRFRVPLVGEWIRKLLSKLGDSHFEVSIDDRLTT